MAGVIAFDPNELVRLRGQLPTGHGCDFCATGEPSFRYPASDVGLGTIVFRFAVLRPVSLGYWRACVECSELVEASDWPALARRSLRSLNLDLSQGGPGLRVRLLAQVRATQECFKRARCGPREKV